MEVRFLDFLKGYVRIRITGDSYDRFLNLCAYHDIRLWDLVWSQGSYEAFITVKDFRQLKNITRKSHASVRITQRHGFPFFVYRYRKRKFYFVSIAAALLFLFWLSSHIWNISIDGNLSQTDDVIFEYLETAGIQHGMPKSEVDCQELASQIRNYFTQFAWVAAELKGTRLLIHVKEGITGTQVQTLEGEEPSSLAADAPGTVVSIYTRKGRPLVKAGDTVEKGDILVSGVLPIYDDSKALSSMQYTAADADIVIRTQTPYTDTVSFETEKKQYTGRETVRHMLKVGEIPFALPQKEYRYEQYDLLSETHQLTLQENFYLPLYLVKFTAKEYENIKIHYKKEEIERILRLNFENFTKNLAEKGVQIFENDVKIEWNEKSATLSGILITGENAVRRIPIDSQEEELLKNEYG